VFLCLQLCQQCFFVAFENEIHKTIVDNRLFKPGERVAIAASGGKGGPFLLLLAFFLLSLSGSALGFHVF
jgi:tRNA(Ile)-lysidine synthase TilS/MesJ